MRTWTSPPISAGPRIKTRKGTRLILALLAIMSVVLSVDLTRYVWTWYEIAGYPNRSIHDRSRGSGPCMPGGV